MNFHGSQACETGMLMWSASDRLNWQPSDETIKFAIRCNCSYEIHVLERNLQASLSEAGPSRNAAPETAPKAPKAEAVPRAHSGTLRYQP